MVISVITVNYNNKDGLKRTIESVLNQTYIDYEYIIVDGNSTDGSKELLDNYKSKFKISHFVSEPDNGIYNAMNKGVSMANGVYCIFMNSGDTFYNEESLSRSLNFLKNKDIVSGVAYLPGGKKMTPPNEEDISTTFFLRYSLNHQSTFIKKELLVSHPYNENYKIVSDTEFFFYSLIIKNVSYLSIPVKIADCEQAGESGNLEASLKERFIAISQYFPMRMTSDLVFLGKYNISLIRWIGSSLRKIKRMAG